MLRDVMSASARGSNLGLGVTLTLATLNPCCSVFRKPSGAEPRGLHGRRMELSHVHCSMQLWLQVPALGRTTTPRATLLAATSVGPHVELPALYATMHLPVGY